MFYALNCSNAKRYGCHRLNILAELLCFGDREFYKDWWNATTVDEVSFKILIPAYTESGSRTSEITYNLKNMKIVQKSEITFILCLIHFTKSVIHVISACERNNL